MYGLALLAIAWLGGSSADTPAAARAAAIREHFDERAEEGFSGVVLAAKGAEVVMLEAYGYRDPFSELPMRVDDVFDIGSIVKPLTAAAIYRLDAEGVLDTADTLETYFDDVPGDKSEITIEHLLHHTAGLPDSLGSDFELIDRETFRSAILTAPRIAPVGESVNYSNSGYALLAIIIEVTTGEPFEEHIRSRFLEPAGTLRIGYALPDWRRDELTVGARGEESFGTPLEHPWFGDGPSWHLRGNGGMLSNAESLLTLFYALEHDRELLPAPARKRWLERYSAIIGGDTIYGVFGGNGFYNSMILRHIGDDFTLVGFSNIREQRVEDSLPFLQELLLPEGDR